MPKASKEGTKILSKNLFPVVGIGASAGGLEAFKKFIKSDTRKFWDGLHICTAFTS